ncbi:double-strand break repair protein AddB [Limoniibacter endophyticus]|uniref:Double-strand break repair protein AddB n=1 Tax=Limoniibacter endophyticus TaxID=1565040 RepID=A0A8J3DJX5_9HYPH|nr:double-strand break repair protein AddB [Limoniibacter endophyticus]GHC74583.1 double-strand break repair protein AddB [Limoniibacter endophyticus]
MTHRRAKLFSISPGAPFSPTFIDALVSGRLVEGFAPGNDSFALAAATIYLPSRRAARSLRAAFVERSVGKAALLPTLRVIGEFDNDQTMLETGEHGLLDMPPPIDANERLLLLAPLVRAWKRRLPTELMARFDEDLVIPASAADAIWLARDLCELMDEVESEEVSWSALSSLVPEDLATWWQLSLDFLSIVSEVWPQVLKELGKSNFSAYRIATLRAERQQLETTGGLSSGPVIAAGYMSSFPAAAELLSAIARLPHGAVVLPGLDPHLDQSDWSSMSSRSPEPALFGHPQYGLARLLSRMRLEPRDVEIIGSDRSDLCFRERVLSEALKPAEATDSWINIRSEFMPEALRDAFRNVSLIEAAFQREEAIAIAAALRDAAADPGKRAALVTGDRDLARRVASELERFGVKADDSGGIPMSRTSPAGLLRLLLEVTLRPGDPVALLSLFKHPLLSLGLPRRDVRRAGETLELILLRGGTGRPDIGNIVRDFDNRLSFLADRPHPPHWLKLLNDDRLSTARKVAEALLKATMPLIELRGTSEANVAGMTSVTVDVLEELGRGEDQTLDELYDGDAGSRLAQFLSGLVAAPNGLAFSASEWPDVLGALMASESVKPSTFADERIAIWGALEARLQSVDLMIIGGLNEGSWPRRAQNGRFMSRVMKSGLELEPPESRIGLAAHDFWMLSGSDKLILTRSVRTGESPSVASRWLQRLLAFLGPDHAREMRKRGQQYIDWARQLDPVEKRQPTEQPYPVPPLSARPKSFSVTEIETLRRDPYALYARRILELHALDPLVRDPNAAERGTLFHEIMHRFSKTLPAKDDETALAALTELGGDCFAELQLPPDVEAVWWPRFLALAPNIVAWERSRADMTRALYPEIKSERIAVGTTETLISGRADRVDLLVTGTASIIDYKTGSNPSKKQAFSLVSPQLALEAALLERGAFQEIGRVQADELAFIRFRPNGAVEVENILTQARETKTASQLAEQAWERLEAMLEFYKQPASGYRSRILPFREGDTGGDYDHLARVLEWSAGADDSEGSDE